jgi:hypothetical protein
MKPFLWGVGVGSIVLLVVIFSAGWVEPSGSAQAREIEASAVLDRFASISIAPLMQDPDREVRLKEMKALDSWKRGDFLLRPLLFKPERVNRRGYFGADHDD